MQMKIESKDLALEIACAIEDLFVATVSSKEDAVELAFSDGQKFVLKVEEV